MQDTTLAMSRPSFDALDNVALLHEVKTLVGRSNSITALLLAHLAEVDARGAYLEVACPSLYKYCIYELRMSEDAAQRRVQAARAVRHFPLLLDMLTDASIHLTGILLLAPHLSADNHAEVLARARYRSKREIQRLVAEIAPRPDVQPTIEPLGLRGANGGGSLGLRRAEAVGSLGSREAAADGSLGSRAQDLSENSDAGGSLRAPSWPEFTAALAGAVRQLTPSNDRGGAPTAPGATPAPIPTPAPADATLRPQREGPFSVVEPLSPGRYRVELTVDQRTIDLLEEARDLLAHQIPDRDLAKVHARAMETLVKTLRKQRRAATEKPRAGAATRAGAGDNAGAAKRAGTAKRVGAGDNAGAADSAGAAKRADAEDNAGAAKRAGAGDNAGAAKRAGTAKRVGAGDNAGATDSAGAAKRADATNGAGATNGASQGGVSRTAGATDCVAATKCVAVADCADATDSAGATDRDGATGRANTATTADAKNDAGATNRAVAASRADPVDATVSVSQSSVSRAGASRYVPAALKRAVWERDRGRCSYVDARGCRCPENGGLEIHHEQAFAKGGEMTLNNLALRCRPHNDLAAQQDFGREFMMRKKAQARQRSSGRAEPARQLTRATSRLE